MKILVIIATMIIAISSFAIYKTLQVPETKIHYHANFLVLKNDQVLDFSDIQYMHTEPCAVVPDPNEIETLDLHDGNGATVHIHAPGITWTDLLTYLKVSDSASQAILNGQLTDTKVLRQNIKDQDRILIIIGQTAKDIQSEFALVASDAAEYDAGTKGVESCGGSSSKLNLLQRFRIAFKL